ncbi:MAG: TonB-dependent receptor [Pseudomonadales bacterium]
MKSSIQLFKKSAIAAAIGMSIAVPASSQGLVLEEIVVTAQKREASVQDISATVNVVSGQAITDFNATNFADLEQLTAGLSLTVQNARTAKVSLRGISNDPESGSEAGVDLYYNDVVVRPDTAFSALYDLERVEVLRGPQGALQGRTSPGGAIIIKTRKPNLEEFDGSIIGQVSDNEGGNGQLAVSIPLLEGVLGVRLAGVYDQNNSTGATNLVTGLEATEEGKSGRIAILFEPNDVFSAHLMHQYYERFTDDPKILDGTDALGMRPTLNASDRQSISRTNDFAELRYNMTTLEMGLEAAGHQFDMVASYQTSDKLANTQNDRAGYQPEGIESRQSSLTLLESNSVELRMSSINDSNWEYMFGLYYLDQDTATQFSAASTAALGINFVTGGGIPVESENLALFTFHNFHFNDRWTLDVGARVQKRNSFRKATVNFQELLSVPVFLEGIRDLVEGGFRANFPLNGVQPEDERGSATNVTGLIALNYEINDDISSYLSVSRANRADGVSISPGPNIAAVGETGMLLYDEEDSTAFELGFKSRLMDGRATLNGSLFYQQFDGYLGRVTGLQINETADMPAETLSDISGGIVFNGDATVYGIEFDGQFLISENWYLGGSMSYAQAEYDDGAQAPCNDREPGEAIGLCDIGGSAISSEPELSVSLNSEFSVPFGANEWYLRGLVKHSGDRQNLSGSAGIGNVTDEFDAYTVLNLFTGIRSAEGQWDISLWAKNLTDDDTILIQEGADATDIAAAGDEIGSYTRVQLVKERTIGLTGRYNF